MPTTSPTTLPTTSPTTLPTASPTSSSSSPTANPVTSSPTPSTPSPSNPAPTAPPSNPPTDPAYFCVGRPDGRYPTPTCAGFVPCKAGIVEAAITCPAGTRFDVALNVCNWEDQVGQCPLPEAATTRRRALLAVHSSASSTYGMQSSTAMLRGGAGFVLMLAPLSAMMSMFMARRASGDKHFIGDTKLQHVM